MHHRNTPPTYIGVLKFVMPNGESAFLHRITDIYNVPFDKEIGDVYIHKSGGVELLSGLPFVRFSQRRLSKMPAVGDLIYFRLRFVSKNGELLARGHMWAFVPVVR